MWPRTAPHASCPALLDSAALTGQAVHVGCSKQPKPALGLNRRESAGSSQVPDEAFGDSEAPGHGTGRQQHVHDGLHLRFASSRSRHRATLRRAVSMERSQARIVCVSSPSPVMVAITEWARYGIPFVFVELAWSSNRDGWIAKPVKVGLWPAIKGTPRKADQARAEWIAGLATKSRGALERLAARGVDPQNLLAILAHAWLVERPAEQRDRAAISSAKRAQREAAILDEACAILRRHAASADEQTPLVSFEEDEALYVWSAYRVSQEVLAWLAAQLRAVPSGREARKRGSAHRPKETTMQMAALALQATIRRETATVGRPYSGVAEIAELLSAAWGDYVDADGERTKGLLRRARCDKDVLAAADRLLDFATTLPHSPAPSGTVGHAPARWNDNGRPGGRRPETARDLSGTCRYFGGLGWRARRDLNPRPLD